MGTPLELVKYNTSTGKFECGAEAIAALRRVKAKVGVVSVCGRARQGKSFILNQLLSEGNTNGFTVGPTHRPCTKVRVRQMFACFARHLLRQAARSMQRHVLKLAIHLVLPKLPATSIATVAGGC